MKCFHRPLKIEGYLFTDIVSGKEVWQATCKCGRVWMTDGGRWFGYKTPKTIMKVVKKLSDP